MTRRQAAKPEVSKAVQAAFDALMKAYPARGDNPRAPALSVFARLAAEGEDLEAIAAAAGRFASAMKAEKREPRMIPHTRTWLSQRRFEDYLSDALDGSLAGSQASAPRAGPNPDHPLAFMVEEIGEAAWRSWIAPLAVEFGEARVAITAPTAFALNHIRKSGWDRQIEQALAARGCDGVDWRGR